MSPPNSDAPHQGHCDSAAMKRMHTIARLLCFFRNRDWRYDPGNPKHEHWREKARRIMWELDKVENGGCHDFPLPSAVDRA